MSAELAELVCRNFHEPLHRYLMRRLANSQRARDVAQEVYLRLLGVEAPELVRSPQAYMFRIASNLLYEKRLRERRDAVLFDSHLMDKAGNRLSACNVPDPGDTISLQRQIDSMLAGLPPHYASILLLKKRDGKSYAAIGKELNLSVHSVKKYLFRATTYCRTQSGIEQ